MKHLTRVAAFAVCTALAAPVGAQDFDAGAAAASAGDYTTALENWLPLAEQGDVTAQYNLGLMHYNGWGVPQDYAEAVRWFRRAAEQGPAIAQANLAFMYYMGHGVLQDYAEAARWYRRAAEQGHADSQRRLGVMYYIGYGFLQDYASAHMWLNIASSNGDELSGGARDEVADLMTPDQIAEAQDRARICMLSGYQDCD